MTTLANKIKNQLLKNPDFDYGWVTQDGIPKILDEARHPAAYDAFSKALKKVGILKRFESAGGFDNIQQITSKFRS